MYKLLSHDATTGTINFDVTQTPNVAESNAMANQSGFPAGIRGQIKVNVSPLRMMDQRKRKPKLQKQKSSSLLKKNLRVVGSEDIAICRPF